MQTLTYTLLGIFITVLAFCVIGSFGIISDAKTSCESELAALRRDYNRLVREVAP